jgi:aminoglycoside 3-N-acetyltransferase I
MLPAVTRTCQHLRPTDLPILHQLLALFGEAFGEPDTYQGAVPTDAYLTALLEKPHFIALAALDGDVVIGGLAAYELEKFERARSEIYIYDLAVREAHRRTGVATALIRTLQGIARDRGAHVIFVQADPGDAPAMALYESLGTREDVHHFDIPVGAGVP